MALPAAISGSSGSSWRSFAQYLKSSLRVRPCISCRGDACAADHADKFSKTGCANTTKVSEVLAFLQLELGFDPAEAQNVIDGLANIGWIRLRNCSCWKSRLFTKYKVQAHTEDGADIVLFEV